MTKHLYVCLVIGFAGCVSTPAAPDKIEAWKNERADHLVAVMGQPTGVTTNYGGTKTYTYTVQESVPHMIAGHRGQGENLVTEYAQCTVKFTVDASNLIKAADVEGESARCHDAVPSNPHTALAH